MSERRKHERVVNSIIDIVYQRVDREGDLDEFRRDECVQDITEILEAFAKQEQIKGMEAAISIALERHSPFAARGIDSAIQQLKEGGHD